jgi:hypothetical protein
MIETLEKSKQNSERKQIEALYRFRSKDIEDLISGDRKSVPKWMVKEYGKTPSLPVVKYTNVSKFMKGSIPEYLKDSKKRKIISDFLELLYVSKDELVDFVSDYKLIDKVVLDAMEEGDLFDILLGKKSAAKLKATTSEEVLSGSEGEEETPLVNKKQRKN